MRTDARWCSPLLARAALTAILWNQSEMARAGSPLERVQEASEHGESVLATRIPSVKFPNTTLLHALFYIGQASGQCLGAVLTTRSLAAAEVPGFDQRDVTLRDALDKALSTVQHLAVQE